MVRSRSNGCRLVTGITLLLQTPDRASSSLTAASRSELALQNMASLDGRVVPHVPVGVQEAGHQRQALGGRQPEDPVRNALGVRRPAQTIQFQVLAPAALSARLQPVAVLAAA